MTTTRQVPESVIRRVVDAATKAPSVHNTQPWRWRADGDVLELWGDRTRQLPVTDPDARNLTLSCGAALHHAGVAAHALGWTVDVERIPDPDRPDLLARMVLTPGTPPPHGAETLDTIAIRCTDRRRFTAWPVPDDRLEHLAATATGAGARALALTDLAERFRAERLVALAAELQRRDDEAVVEQESWLDRPGPDGIPRPALPEPSQRPPAPSHRFAPDAGQPVPEPDLDAPAGMVVLFDVSDDPAAWLRAGEGLSALWLAATHDGLSVVPLSQVVEVPEVRRAFAHDVLGGLALPVVVARVGWQAIGRDGLRRTPRRPLDEVLEVVRPGPVRPDAPRARDVAAGSPGA